VTRRSAVGGVRGGAAPHRGSTLRTATVLPAAAYDDPRGGEVREGRPVDAGDVVDVGPTPVMRAVIGLAVGLVIGALLALLLPRGGVRRR